MAATEHLDATTAEFRLSEQVRQAALREIKNRSLTAADLAPLLGLSQTALYLLSLKKSWPLALSVNVAEALGLRVGVTISPNGSSTSAEARAV